MSAKLRTPYVDLLPPLTDEERRSLEVDLLENGQQCDVLIDEHGNIIDGHNRAAILGERVRTRVISGWSEAEKKAAIFRSAEGRRNLTADQKRALLEQKKQIAFALRAEDPHKYTQQRTADKVGVERSTVAKWFAEAPSITNVNGHNGYKPDARVKLDDERRAEAARRVEAGETQAAVARDMGVSQPAVSKALKAASESSEDPVAAERRSDGRRKPPPRIDHAAREAAVRAAHEEGLGTHEIAKRLNIAPTSVSHVKVKLGIAASSAPLKLWSDVDHAVTTLEGAALSVEKLCERLEASELAADEQEIKRCINSLSQSKRTVLRLLSALKRSLR